MASLLRLWVCNYAVRYERVQHTAVVCQVLILRNIHCLYRELPPRNPKHRRVELLLELLLVDVRRSHHQLEVGILLADVHQQPDQDVRRHVPLVGLVHDDARLLRQKRVALNLVEHNCILYEQDARVLLVLHPVLPVPPG